MLDADRPLRQRMESAPVEEAPLPFSLVLERELDALEAGRAPFTSGTSAPGSRQALPAHQLEDRLTGPESTARSQSRAHRLRPFGLALSGGGIRSATFNLGLLQSLARLGLLKHLDYISSVSGGGYIACWLHAWIMRRSKALGSSKDGLQEVERALTARGGDAEAEEVRWLRKYSNYLTPRPGLFGDRIPAAFAATRNILLNQLLVTLLATVLLSLPWLVLAIPVWMARVGLLTASFRWCVGLLGCVFLLLGALLAGQEMARLACGPASAAVGSPLDAQHPPRAEQGFRRNHVVRRAIVSTAALLAGCVLVAFSLVATPLASSRMWTGFTALPGAAYMLGILCGWGRTRAVRPRVGSRSHWPPNRVWPWQRAAGALIASMVLALVTWRLAVFNEAPLRSATAYVHYALFCVPALVATLTLAIIFHLGIAGLAFGEPVREWWGHTSAVLAILAAGWALLSAFAWYGPYAVIWSDLPSELLTAWVVGTGAGVVVKWSESRFRGWRWLITVAPYVFFSGLLILVSYALYRVALGEAGLSYSAPDFDAYANRALDLLQHTRWWHFAAAEAGLLGILSLLSFTVDVNVFNLHMLYRNRLERGFLGASGNKSGERRWVDVDPCDAPRLSELTLLGSQSGQRPYPILNASINLTRVSNLAWAERKAGSFAFTPEFCGYELSRSRQPAAYQPTSDYVGSSGGLSLSAPMTISGAAVNPNSAAIVSPALAALMTLFNLRLGWWMQNPAHARAWKKPGPVFALPYLLRELGRRSDERGRFVHLSDGAHFENLGLYELVRRRCRYIIVSDAACDPHSTLSDLSNAVRKCRIDLGVEIELNPGPLAADPETGRSLAHCVAGVIHYPEANGDVNAAPGYLLYLKATVTGNEPGDVAECKSAHPRFPHESTADQWFGESQFESYRALGEHAAWTMLHRSLEDEHLEHDYRGGVSSLVVERALRTAQGQELDKLRPKATAWMPDLESVFIRLSERWLAPARTARSSARHQEQLERMLNRARTEVNLTYLEWELFPEWKAALRDAASPAGAEAVSTRRTQKELRAGFAFCSELIGFMETVYDDLQLEADLDHPDHRGWMNLFRQWAGSKTFRSTWAIAVPNHGARFQKFAERNFHLYSGSLILGPWAAASRLLDGSAYGVTAGDYPNEIEREHLGRLKRVCDLEQPELWERLYALPLLLQFEDPRTTASGPGQVVVGMALVSKSCGLDSQAGVVLHYFRIRDHIRKMGLGWRGVEALWRSDCRITIQRLQHLERYIPEADQGALSRLWSSVQSVVPHAPILHGEALLQAHDAAEGARESTLLLRDAAHAFGQALEIQPNCEEAIRGLARVLRRSSVADDGDPQPPLAQAIELLEEALHANPYAHLAHHDLACCLAICSRPGNDGAAVEHAVTAIAQCPPCREAVLLDRDLARLRGLIEERTPSAHRKMRENVAGEGQAEGGPI